MDAKTTKSISKFLSLLLRHRPEVIGLELEEAGWTSVEELLKKMNAAGRSIDFDLLKYVVENNSKQRFGFNADKTKIRANQGHSLKIELDYEPLTPPGLLYHGTAKRNLNSILKSGLDKRQRHHVHLSTDAQTAREVGARHGSPIILKIQALLMHRAGHIFYQSENGVWLTEHVPVQFIDQP